MPTQTYQAIMADLRQKKYAPVYMLMGEEGYYIDQLSDFFQKNILSEAESGFDLTVLYGKDIDDINTVANIARRFPMMGSHQVVIIKEAQNIRAWSDLKFYLSQPQPSTILVFCYKHGTADKRTEAYKLLSKIGVVFESPKLRDYQIQPWIRDYAREKRVPIDDKAIVLLADSLGTDLSKLVHELDKLVLGKPENMPTITAELVERNIGISKDFNTFELQNALIKGDVLKANRIVRYFADNSKNNPIQVVLGTLFNFFANLMIYHYLGDKSKENVASALKINPYFVRDYEEAARRFNALKTMYIISWIRDADARSKGVENPSATDVDIWKELIFKILH